MLRLLNIDDVTLYPRWFLSKIGPWRSVRLLVIHTNISGDIFHSTKRLTLNLFLRQHEEPSKFIVVGIVSEEILDGRLTSVLMIVFGNETFLANYQTDFRLHDSSLNGFLQLAHDIDFVTARQVEVAILTAITIVTRGVVVIVLGNVYDTLHLDVTLAPYTSSIIRTHVLVDGAATHVESSIGSIHCTTANTRVRPVVPKKTFVHRQHALLVIDATTRSRLIAADLAFGQRQRAFVIDSTAQTGIAFLEYAVRHGDDAARFIINTTTHTLRVVIDLTDVQRERDVGHGQAGIGIFVFVSGCRIIDSTTA